MVRLLVGELAASRRVYNKRPMYGCSLSLSLGSDSLALALALTLNSYTHTFASLCMTFTSVWFAFYFHGSCRSPVIIYLNPSRRAFDCRSLSVDITYILRVQKRRHSIHLWKCCLKSSRRVVLFAFSLFWLSHVCSVLFRIMCYCLNWLSASVWFYSFVRLVHLCRVLAHGRVSRFFSVDCRSLSYRILYNFLFFSPLHTGQCVLCLPGRVRLPFFGFHFHLATVRESTAREVVAFCS